MASVLERKIQQAEVVIPVLSHIIAQYAQKTIEVQVGDGDFKHFSRYKFAERFLRQELIAHLERLAYHKITDQRKVFLTKWGNFFRAITFYPNNQTFEYERINYNRVNLASVSHLWELVEELSGIHVEFNLIRLGKHSIRYCDKEFMHAGEEEEDLTDTEEQPPPELNLTGKKRKRSVLTE